MFEGLYTGLTDKNGGELCVGDTVQINYEFMPEDTGVIKYYAPEACMIIDFGDGLKDTDYLYKLHKFIEKRESK